MVRGVMQLLQWIFTVWVLITILFLLTKALPNEQQLLLRFANTAGSGSGPSSQQVAAAQQAVRQRLGLTEPVFYVSPVPHSKASGWRWHWNGPHNQYHHWLRALLHGNLGQSYYTQEPVTALLGEALGVTAPLACLAALLVVGLSIPMGLWLAARSSSHWVLTVLLALDALPLFVIALLLMMLLASPDYFSLFPVFGLSSEEGNSSISSVLKQPAFLILPLASLVLSSITEPTVQLANALRHEAQLDYIVTARAKGLAKTKALRRHALRNALLPTLTLFTELLPNLLAGAVVVELIFALPGLGRLVADAAAARDYPVLLGGVLVSLVVRRLLLVFADWLYQLADPRLRILNR